MYMGECSLYASGAMRMSVHSHTYDVMLVNNMRKKYASVFLN